MKLLSGSHLTQTNKKHINHLIENKIMQGKINRISYFLKSLNDKKFEVMIKQNDRGFGFIGNKLRLSTYKSIIQF